MTETEACPEEIHESIGAPGFDSCLHLDPLLPLERDGVVKVALVHGTALGARCQPSLP
jgi:hypothetical protein